MLGTKMVLQRGYLYDGFLSPTASVLRVTLAVEGALLDANGRSAHYVT
jgi:hypothetical protein